MQQNAVTLHRKKIDLIHARQRCLAKTDPHFLLGGVRGADTIYREVRGLFLSYDVIRREASQAAMVF